MMKCLITLLIISFPSYLLANDGAYYMSGNQLVPMHENNISVAKERLSIVRDGDYINVNVHYEFVNDGPEADIIVGFEAFAPEGDADWMPVNGEHPYMQDFTVKMNGKPLDYEVAVTPYQDGHSDIRESLKDVPFYFENGEVSNLSTQQLNTMNEGMGHPQFFYVYHFDANFVPGKNVVQHSYRFALSTSIADLFSFDYVLQAVNRWGDGGIDDFRLEIDMGDMIEFSVVSSFFDDASDWEIIGKGRGYAVPDNYLNYTTDDEDEITNFAMYGGSIVFERKDFKPRGDLFLSASQFSTIMDTFDAEKHNLSLNLWFDVMMQASTDDEARYSELTKKVLQNYPFARRGYVFKDAEIQAYFDSQKWYMPDPNYTVDLDALDARELDLYNKMKALRQ